MPHYFSLDIGKRFIYSLSMQLNIEKLKAELKRTGMSHSALAKKMKISRQAVGFYVKGEVGKSFKAIVKLADALKMDPKDLII